MTLIDPIAAVFAAYIAGALAVVLALAYARYVEKRASHYKQSI